MKTLVSFFFILIFGWSNAQINNQTTDFKNMTHEQQKEYIHKLSPDERRALFRKFRENMLISELKIPEAQQEAFRQVYNEYATQQREIKNKFSIDKKPDQLNNEEAKTALDNSFEIAQQLLNSRKDFSKRFLQILSPQQVMKMYHIEGKTRNEMMDRKPETK